MSDKQLKEKAIDIKGSEYVLVKDRVIFFNKEYPNGAINTELISDPTSDIIIVKATVTPDCDKPDRRFTDYSQAVKGAGFINKTAALENASTSAVGRALAYCGIGVIDSVASADEINKATGTDSNLASAKQNLYKKFKEQGITDSQSMNAHIQQATGKDSVETVADVNKVIKHLQDEDN